MGRAQPFCRIQLAVFPKKTNRGLACARYFYALGDFDLFGLHEEWFQLLERWIVDPAKCLREYHEITTYGYRAFLLKWRLPSYPVFCIVSSVSIAYRCFNFGMAKQLLDHRHVDVVVNADRSECVA